MVSTIVCVEVKYEDTTGEFSEFIPTDVLFTIIESFLMSLFKCSNGWGVMSSSFKLEIVSNVLNRTGIELRPEMQASDVEGWDSLSHVQIIYNCELKFGIQFSLSEGGVCNFRRTHITLV